MDDSSFQNRPRRVMEAQGGAEVRRVHILYFLSRNGRNEHPHLIRIHHLSRNGVRLRDIKRWLGQVRGKDMPDSFAWSYKRRYRAEYVWQDIRDDDLVTPISDNEYFLKGSQISTNHNMDFSTTPMQKQQSPLQESPKHSQTPSKHKENNLRSSSSSSIQDSSETSTSTEDSTLDGLDGTNLDLEASSPASKSMVLLKKRKPNKVEMTINGKSRSSSCNTADKPHHRKSHSRGSIFQNLITCGGVETNDSVVTVSNKRYKPLLKTCACVSTDSVRDSVKEKGEYGQHRAAYRPLYGPNCSQCGKTFKPEKLHSHMSSCKGMKALAKKSKASTNGDSGSAHILAQNC